MERKIDKEMECVRVLRTRTRTGYWVVRTRTGYWVLRTRTAYAYAYWSTRTGKEGKKKEERRKGTHA